MSDEYGILLEDMNHKFDLLMEGQTLLAPMSQKLDSIDQRLSRVENEVVAIERILSDHEGEHQNYETRITKLEHAI